MSSFSRMANVTAATKRPPALDANGQRGEPASNIASLSCTPLDPADGEQARDLAIRLSRVLESPIQILQTFVDASLDIVEGDVLVVSSREYPIRGVNNWSWRGARYLHLLLEDSKP